MSGPVCTDCGATMQNIQGMWRCPWTSIERWHQARRAYLPVVTCEWPLERPRQAVGLPNGQPQ